MKMIVSWYNVRDLEKAKSFYGNVLGLKKTFEMPGWAELSHAEGATSIGIAQASKPVPREGGATVVLGVENLDQTVERLKDRGVEFEGKI